MEPENSAEDDQSRENIDMVVGKVIIAEETKGEKVDPLDDVPGDDVDQAVESNSITVVKEVLVVYSKANLVTVV